MRCHAAACVLTLCDQGLGRVIKNRPRHVCDRFTKSSMDVHLHRQQACSRLMLAQLGYNLYYTCIILYLYYTQAGKNICIHTQVAGLATAKRPQKATPRMPIQQKSTRPQAGIGMPSSRALEHALAFVLVWSLARTPHVRRPVQMPRLYR